VTGQGTKELIEAAWPIIVKGREADARILELAQEEDEEREAPADYNPALVQPLSRGPRKGGAPEKLQAEKLRPLKPLKPGLKLSRKPGQKPKAKRRR
jgi:hypothetical protein